ncbi:MAG: SRPBCC family protein [Bacteroidia bacterium]|nr:SRPBCC family protein [Bacteroidia bacterium]
MSQIKLTTYIKASVEKCFDLSRDVNIHERSATQTKERAVSGRTSGLFELNDTVTWEATHFGIRQKLTVKITKTEAPAFFEDTMLKGAFKSMVHGHYFENENGQTKMTDIFYYEVPLGPLGVLFDRLVLKTYMTKFLLKLNELIKEVAERESFHR